MTAFEQLRLLSFYLFFMKEILTLPPVLIKLKLAKTAAGRDNEIKEGFSWVNLL